MVFLVYLFLILSVFIDSLLAIHADVSCSHFLFLPGIFHEEKLLGFSKDCSRHDFSPNGACLHFSHDSSIWIR